MPTTTEDAGMSYPTADANERPGTWVYVGADNGDYGDEDEYIYVPSCEELV